MANDNVTSMQKPVAFTIDGRPFETSERTGLLSACSVVSEAPADVTFPMRARQPA